MPKRVDTNQKEIVAGLRKIGATVQHLHTIGKDCPDILVGYRNKNYVFEIKYLNGKLTFCQVAWHTRWRGQVDVVSSVEEALEIMK